MLQFLELYRFVSSEALVYLLPTPRDCDLQDLVFNPFWALSLAIYLTHRQDAAWFRTATIVVSSMIIATSMVLIAITASQARWRDLTRSDGGPC